MLEVVLRRAGRVIGMRVIEADEFSPALARVCFGGAIVGRTHQETPARPFLGGIGQRERLEHTDHATGPGRANERAAAFVRVRGGGFCSDRLERTGLHNDPRHRTALAPWSVETACTSTDSGQKPSDR